MKANVDIASCAGHAPANGKHGFLDPWNYKFPVNPALDLPT
jgi:hypothetical protein